MSWCVSLPQSRRARSRLALRCAGGDGKMAPHALDPGRRRRCRARRRDRRVRRHHHRARSGHHRDRLPACRRNAGAPTATCKRGTDDGMSARASCTVDLPADRTRTIRRPATACRRRATAAPSRPQCIEAALACIGRGPFCCGVGALCQQFGTTLRRHRATPPMLIPTTGMPMLEPHCQFTDDVCCPGCSTAARPTDPTDQ